MHLWPSWNIKLSLGRTCPSSESSAPYHRAAIRVGMAQKHNTRPQREQAERQDWGSVNWGFQTDVWVLWEDQIPLPSIQPLYYLNFDNTSLFFSGAKFYTSSPPPLKIASVCCVQSSNVSQNGVRIRSGERRLEGGRGLRGRSGWMALKLLGKFLLYVMTPDSINSVQTRCIVKTSGFTRGFCKNRWFY